MLCKGYTIEKENPLVNSMMKNCQIAVFPLEGINEEAEATWTFLHKRIVYIRYAALKDDDSQ